MARADHLVLTPSHCPILFLSSLLLFATRMISFMPRCKLFPHASAESQNSFQVFISCQCYVRRTCKVSYLQGKAVFKSCIAVQPGVILSDESKNITQGVERGAAAHGSMQGRSGSLLASLSLGTGLAHRCGRSRGLQEHTVHVQLYSWPSASNSTALQLWDSTKAGAAVAVPSRQTGMKPASVRSSAIQRVH